MEHTSQGKIPSQLVDTTYHYLLISGADENLPGTRGTNLKSEQKKNNCCYPQMKILGTLSTDTLNGLSICARMK